METREFLTLYNPYSGGIDGLYDLDVISRPRRTPMKVNQRKARKRKRQK